MITDEEAIRLLELADPARVDDAVPVPDPAEYRSALNTRRPAVTLIDHERPATQPTSGRRWPILIAAAAAVVLVVGVLVVRGHDDNSRIEVPAAPPSTSTVETSVAEVRPFGSPIDCERARCPWSPELTVHALEPPIPGNGLHNLAVAPDGTLVALDPIAGTLTWYEDEPRVVSLTADVVGDGSGQLAAIGPHDIAYIASPAWDTVVATAPSGEEITQLAWQRNRDAPSFQTAAGLGTGTTWLVPDSFAVPWVDLDGDPIIDSRPYPTAAVTDAGIEVRLGDEEWLLTEEAGTRLVPLDFLARSDGGVVMVLDTYVVELSPDGSIGRYVLNAPAIVLPDGSLIVEYGSQVARLIPPTVAITPTALRGVEAVLAAAPTHPGSAHNT